MSLYLLALLLLLSGTGGIALGSALMNIFGWLSLIILLALIWEYKLFIFLFILSVSSIIFVRQIITDYLKYKDETPEEREERLKTTKMIEEWRNRNNF